VSIRRRGWAFVSLARPVGSDHQLARLLQIGIVLEEVVEARAAKHVEVSDADLDPEVRAFLNEAVEESADHRARLETLLAELDADTVAFEEIEPLVAERYEADDDFDGVLYDQLCNEETAYKFYEDLLAAIENSEVQFPVEREYLRSVLEGIKADEKAGVERVTELMEERT
jgi:rubrerythrin